MAFFNFIYKKPRTKVFEKDGIKYKPCSRCKKDKILNDNFYISKLGHIDAMCFDCRSEYNRELKLKKKKLKDQELKLPNLGTRRKY